LISFLICIILIRNIKSRIEAKTTTKMQTVNERRRTVNGASLKLEAFMKDFMKHFPEQNQKTTTLYSPE
jgi:hypothetical protein